MQPRHYYVPYQFVEPYRGRLWYRLVTPLLPRMLRRDFAVHRVVYEQTDRLRDSVAAGHGVMLPSNHVRNADTPVLGTLAGALGTPFYYMASWHLFSESRRARAQLRRAGGISLFREGTDRQAIRTVADILATAERPVVIYPEGSYFHENERLAPPQPGFAMIAQLAERKGQRPVVVHPLAIRYWCLEDPVPPLCRELESLERALHWNPQTDLSPTRRLHKLVDAAVAVKEIDLLGKAGAGSLDGRAARLVDAVCARTEAELGLAAEGDWYLERLRHVRNALVKRLHAATGAERQLRHRDLDDLWYAQIVANYGRGYLEPPTLNRWAEKVDQLLEDVRQREPAYVSRGAVVRVGPALAVADHPDRNALVAAVAGSIRDMLADMTAAGPPPEWNGPANVGVD